jgi:eukaryotic-like serine/threonine-protein kinase
MIYRFGIFDFEVESGQLRKDTRPVSLERQPARVLAVLLARAGELVSREELRESVWGSETHVDFDRGLAYCLSHIRGALGDRSDNPRFVQTFPKRG